MGFLGWAIAGAVGVGLISATKKEEAERKAREAEERRRTSSPCMFNDGISKTEFEALAIREARRIKRIESVKVDGPVVKATASSQSGITAWGFSLDFNDYGHITGRYWVSTDNNEAQIPHRLAELIKVALQHHFGADPEPSLSHREDPPAQNKEVESLYAETDSSQHENLNPKKENIWIRHHRRKKRWNIVKNVLAAFIGVIAAIILFGNFH